MSGVGAAIVGAVVVRLLPVVTVVLVGLWVAGVHRLVHIHASTVPPWGIFLKKLQSGRNGYFLDS